MIDLNKVKKLFDKELSPKEFADLVVEIAEEAIDRLLKEFNLIPSKPENKEEPKNDEKTSSQKLLDEIRARMSGNKPAKGC